MPKLPRITSRKPLQVLSRAGFYIHHQTGSHANLRHRTKTQLHLVVPRYSGDLALKTLQTIIIQADMTVEEFVALLND
jgi:predicted RNA binding protein YcfA (HicA-like mRNA interferase family)